MVLEKASVTKRNREEEEEPQQQGGSDGAAKQSKSASTIVKLDLKALDCTICFDPLKPPVLQCVVGHAICSSCYGKLRNKDKCQTCAIASGYNRCFVVEHILQSVRVRCSNSTYGCTIETAYHEMEEHESKCPHAPCFCPEAGCGFAGSTDALLDHFTATHKWPSTEFTIGLLSSLEVVHEGMLILHSKDGSMFLVKFTPAGPFGTATSVFCVKPHAAVNTNFKCYLDSPCLAMGWYQRTRFQVRSTTLSDGLQPVDCCSVVVPGVTPISMYITIILIQTACTSPSDARSE